MLRGPVVDTFDREFRILFAASLPVSDVRRAAGAPVERTDQLNDASELHLRADLHTERKRLPLKPPIPNPPSPPADSFLDWEAMGVVQLFPDDAEQMPPLDDLQFDRNRPITDGSAENGNQYLDMKRCMNHLDKCIYISVWIIEYSFTCFEKQGILIFVHLH